MHFFSVDLRFVGALKMHEHYQLSEDEWKELQGKGVEIKHLYKALEFFDPFKSGCEISTISLYHYVDKKGGDFISKQNFPNQKIAKFLFDRLPVKEKINLAEYIGDMENGEF